MSAGAPLLHTPGTRSIELMDFRDARRDPGIVQAWQRLLARYEHPNLVYSSPEWAEHTEARGVHVHTLVVRDGVGSVVGIVPVWRHRIALGDDGSHGFRRPKLDLVDVLGSVPLVADETRLLRELVDRLLKEFPESDGVHFDSLPGDNPCWTLPGDTGPGLLRYSPSGLEDSHLVELRDSFESYLRGLRPKSRYNVQRALRKLRAASEGKLELSRCQRPDQVDAFHRGAAEVWRRCQQRAHFRDLSAHPQTRKDGLEDLARRGLLRSYLLSANETPCAFVIGYQHRGIYFYVGTGYDETWARHSPGSVLLYLLLEDLFAVDRPRLLSFGKGDQEYKRRFGTLRETGGRLLLLRPSLQNAGLLRAHQLLTRVSELLRARPRER